MRQRSSCQPSFEPDHHHARPRRRLRQLPRRWRPAAAVLLRPSTCGPRPQARRREANRLPRPTPHVRQPRRAHLAAPRATGVHGPRCHRNHHDVRPPRPEGIPRRRAHDARGRWQRRSLGDGARSLTGALSLGGCRSTAAGWELRRRREAAVDGLHVCGRYVRPVPGLLVPLGCDVQGQESHWRVVLRVGRKPAEEAFAVGGAGA